MLAEVCRRGGDIRSMADQQTRRVRITISGQVQGVGFRPYVYRLAAESHLAGWVLNGPSGVVIEAEGAPAAVEEFLQLLPAELQAFLPASPTSPSPALEPIAPPPVVHPANDHLLDDACTLLAYLQNHPLRPGPPEEWSPADQARLSRQLRNPAIDRLALMRHLAQRLNWLRPDRSGLLRPDPETVTAWLQAPPSEQRAALAQAWRDSASWS